MAAIETEQLTKKFGSTPAVEDLSLAVEEGDIYGFLGLNGAGKTTTIRMLLGMIRPTSGSIRLFGQHLPQNATQQRGLWNQLGYMVETPHAYPELTVEENLKIFYRLRGIRNTSFLKEILERLHLDKYRTTQAQHLSLGNAQRLGLAKALLHQPRLLILDEPINGLDPAGILEVREMMRDLARNGTTIFLSSHILSEIAKTATHIGILHGGRLVRQLLTKDLHQCLTKTLFLKTNAPKETLQLLRQRDLYADINEQGMIQLSDGYALSHPEEISLLCLKEGFSLQHLSVVEEDLEHFFLRTIQPYNEEIQQ